MALQIYIVIAQLPILTDPGYNRTNPVVGTVHVKCSKPTTIGGLRLYWATTVSRLVERKENKTKWRKPKVMDCSDQTILDLEQVIPAGENKYEFVFHIDADTVDTRDTHFDRIKHTLSAALLSASPCYDRIEDGCISSSSTAPSDTAISVAPKSMFNVLKKSIKAGFKTPSNSPPSSDDESPYGGVPVLAAFTHPIAVFRTCCSQEHEAVYRFMHPGIVPLLNADYRYSLSSHNLALGGKVDLELQLENLPADATVHAVGLALTQITTPAPNLPSSGSSTLADIRDTYTLFQQGSTWATITGRMRPPSNSYIWRGQVARQLDNLPPDQPLEMPFPKVKARIHLPSPIIGAVPTFPIPGRVSTPDIPAASISHSLDLTLYFSTLRPKNPDDSEDEKERLEGVVQVWTIEKDLILGSDTTIAGQTAPPGYKSGPGTRIGITPKPQDPIIPSAAMEHEMSKEFLGGTRMARVDEEEKALRKRIYDHWYQTEGLCECFCDRPDPPEAAVELGVEGLSVSDETSGADAATEPNALVVKL